MTSAVALRVILGLVFIVTVEMGMLACVGEVRRPAIWAVTTLGGFLVVRLIRHRFW